MKIWGWERDRGSDLSPSLRGVCVCERERELVGDVGGREMGLPLTR